MLVVKEVLSAQALVCLEKLKVLDLAPVARRLMNPRTGDGWTRQQALQAIRRYKTFLFISYLYPHIVLVPTQEIDQVWHCHILHTCKYRQDCEMLFGYFIDHEPESTVSSETHQQNLDAAFAQTQALLALWESYFEADSQETELLSLEELAFTKCQLQLGYEGDKGDLHLQRGACGRPKN